jgi:cobalt-zinc-cadmium efflux system membrane fusion protein
VVATLSGTVVERPVTQGQVVQPSDVIFTVADLSRVWVEAEVPEQQAASVRSGQNISVEIPSLGRSLTAKLIYIADTVNPASRTVLVRSEVDNRDRSLKPAMHATVLIEGPPTERVVVPDAAVVRENNKDYLFVEVGPTPTG